MVWTWGHDGVMPIYVHYAKIVAKKCSVYSPDPAEKIVFAFNDCGEKYLKYFRFENKAFRGEKFT
jgi:hypothetical protein